MKSKQVLTGFTAALEIDPRRAGINFKPLLYLFALLCLVLSLSTRTAVAQSAFGSISGTVTDPAGAVVPGAKVTVTNESTGTQQTTETNSTGDFVFPALRPATYTITAEKQGFEKLEKTAAVLVAAQQLTLGKFQLQVGSTTAEVTVSAEGTGLETTSSDVSSTLSYEELTKLPSLGRDYVAGMRALPGSDFIGEGNYSGSLGSTSIHFNGLSGTGTGSGTSINTNGVDSSGGGQGTSSDEDSADLESIQDVHVLQGTYDAEYGGVVGAVINVTTRSGTSQYHGGLYYYLRNEDLNANDYFTKRAGQPRARYRFNTFGGSAGGPVPVFGLRSKLFFFGNYDDEPSTSPNGLAGFLMPTALERSGDYSQSYIPGSNTLYNVVDPTTGKQFPGNVIPPNRVDLLMQATYGVFPMPNYTSPADVAISQNAYNYVTAASTATPTNRESLRFDYSPAAKWQIFGRWQRAYSGGTGVNEPGILAGWQNGSQTYSNQDERWEFGATYTISKNLVNQASGGFIHNHELMGSPASTNAQFQQTAATTFPNPYSSENPLNLLPAMEFSNGSGWEYEPRFPLNDTALTWSVSDGLTFVAGEHQLKFGAFVDTAISLQPHHTGQWGNAGSGIFNFSAPDPNSPNNTGNPFAEGLLGLYDSYQSASTRFDLDDIGRNFEWYAQDSWRVKRRLTLNYGLRFILDIPVKSGNQYGSTIDFSLYNPTDAPPLFQPVLVNGVRMMENPVTLALEPAAYEDEFVPGVGNPAAGSVSVGNKPLANSRGVLIAPRFGFAYDLIGNGKTVIRGGFGKFYTPRTRSGFVYNNVTNAPTVFYPTQYYGTVESVASNGGLLGPSTEQYMDPNGHLPYSFQYSLGVKRDIGFKTVADVSYVANVLRHGQYSINLNEVPYGAEFLAANQDSTTGAPLPDDYYRPFPGYSSITALEFGDNTNYNSLQATATRQFAHNLTFVAAYTWSKAIDDNKTTRYLPSSMTYGPVIGTNRPNRVTADWVWELPKTGAHWNNWLTRSALDNWAFSGVDSFISGPSSMASCSPSNGLNITGGGDGYQCVKDGSAALSKGDRTFNKYFNTGAFALPAVGQVGNQWNASFYGPGVNNWDLSIFKTISMKEKLKGVLRADMFNAFNHTQYNSVNSGATFDPATGNQLNANFGQLNNDSGPRIVQVSTRIDF